MIDVAFQEFAVISIEGGLVPDLPVSENQWFDEPPIEDQPPPTEDDFINDVAQILTGTGGTISAADLDLISPEEWDSFIASLLGFVNVTSGGADQNSYYNDHSNEAPLGEYFIQEWGFLPSIQHMPGYHYFDYLTNDIDPEFLEWAYAAHLTSDIIRDNGGSMSAIEGVPITVVVQGAQLLVTWHSGTPSSTGIHTNPNDPNEIIVSASMGHYTIVAQPPGPSTGNESPPSSFDLMEWNTTNYQYFRVVQQAIQYLDDVPLAVEVLRGAVERGTKIVIVTGQSETVYDPISNSVFWNPGAAVRLTNGGLMSSAMALLHELAHAVVQLTNTPTGDAYGNEEDRYIIQHYEAVIGAALHEPTRQDHLGEFVFNQTDVTHSEPAPDLGDFHI